MWVQYHVEYPWKLGLWDIGSMYVAGIPGKISKAWLFFEGQIGKILEGGWEIY